jgi:Heterokaryon incompatibility protein (HET)
MPGVGGTHPDPYPDPDPAAPPAPNSNVESSEEQHSKSSLGKLRSVVYKVIQQNQEKGLSRTNFPGSRFRSVVEEVVRQKNAYKYQPIDHDNEIRILRLLRGKKGDALKCTLFPSSLRSTRSTSKLKCYEYCALSYVWGDNKVTDQLTVYDDFRERDGFLPRTRLPYTLYVWANLAAALQNIRRDNEDVNLWVDAVCINQADDEENYAQIGLMTRIYTDATSVRVWLGDRSVDASLAFDLLKALANLRTQDELPDIKAKGEIWKSVINLTKDSYWTSMWTLGGFALGKDVQFMWAFETIKSEAMERAWSTILTRRKQVEPVLHEAGFDDFSIKEFFDRLTAHGEFLSNGNTIQAASVDQTFITERATPAARLRTIEYLIKEATAPMIGSHIRSEERYTLHAPK